MTTASRLIPTPCRTSPWRQLLHRLTLSTLLLPFLPLLVVGCGQQAPVETYTIPTKVPEQLLAGKERMLAAMFAHGDLVWFYKVSGPEAAIDEIDSDFRKYVEAIEFRDDVPDLSSLPEGWHRGASRAMRFATIHIDTPTKQLDVSISQLPRQGDWDEQVKMNVNRWRGQLGLTASDEKWAEAESLQVAAAEQESVWVDLLGDPSGSSPAMAPFHGGVAGGPGSLDGASPGGAATTSQRPTGPATASASSDPRLKYDRPDGWRDGQTSSMRLAAFAAGPEDASAEMTVIPAGGDLRGNVARWLGQIRGGEVPDEVVDQALADAQPLEVDGRPAQRFFLTGGDGPAASAIDATVIPLDNGMSLFVKMTGPLDTVSQQADAIASFLESLEFQL